MAANQPTDCTVGTCPIEDSFIVYLPNITGNAIYLAIFAVLFALQLGLGIFYRTWGFLAGMIVGLALEVLGYVGRLQLHSNPFIFNNFLLYLIGVTIGPAALNASIYLCLSHIVVVYRPHPSFLSPKTYTSLFIGSDFIALVLQAAGGAITATADDRALSDKGTNIMVAGLAWQVCSLIVFMALGAQFARSVRNTGNIPSGTLFESVRQRRRFKLFLIALSAATVTIFIRCVYRVAELSQGFKGSIANNETAFMILEGPMIIVAIAAITLFHPGFAFSRQWHATSWTSVSQKKSEEGH